MSKIHCFKFVNVFNDTFTVISFFSNLSVVVVVVETQLFMKN